MRLTTVLPRIHEAVGGLFILAALVAFAWALAAARRRRPLSMAFWGFLRYAVGGLFGLQVLIGLGLLALGLRVPTPLHWLYVVLLLLGVGGAEMLRPGSGLRQVIAGEGHFDEARTYWILMIFIAVLGMRAYTTGLLGF